MANMAKFDGITGSMKFDANRDPIKCAVIVPRVTDKRLLCLCGIGLPQITFQPAQARPPGGPRCIATAGAPCRTAASNRQSNGDAMDFLLQQMLNALQWGSFYALIALGYTLVYGVLRLINFAHGDIFMVGAYISFFVATYLLSPAIGLSKPVTLWLTIVLTMLLTALVGVTLERIAYRPLRRKGAHRLYVVITALMCGLILENGNLALLGATKRKLP